MQAQWENDAIDRPEHSKTEIQMAGVRGISRAANERIEKLKGFKELMKDEMETDGTDEQEPNSEECNDGMGSQSTGDEAEFDQDCLGSLTYSPSDDGWMFL